MGAQLNGMEFRQRMEGFLASGDARGARDFMSRYARLAGLRPEDSNQKWLLAHNNPGSVTVDGRNFAAYETPRDGLKAVMGCLASYHRKGSKSIRAMISRYAPPSENDTEAYVRQVAAKTGLDPERELDLRDPRVLAALTGAIIGQEHSVKADEAELLAAAAEFLRTGRPRPVGVIRRNRAERTFLPGFDPASFRSFSERVEALEKSQTVQADLDRATAILAEVQKLPVERRDLEMLRRIQDLPRDEAERLRPLLKRGVEERKSLDHLARSFQLRDAFTAALAKMPEASEESLTALALNMFSDLDDPALREELKSFAAMEIRNRRETRAANDALDVENFLQRHKGQSPASIQAALGSSSLSPQARARAAQLSWGLAKEENPLNIQATSLALMLRDSGALESESELQAYAAANGLTLTQTKEIRAYRGKAAQVSISRVNNLLKNLKNMDGEEFDGPEQIDARGYRLLLEQIQPGHEPSDLELVNLLARLYTHDGGSFFGLGKTSLKDQLLEGKFDNDWLPEFKPWQEQELEAELKSRGLRPSDTNKKILLKLKLFQEQGLPSPSLPAWEK